MKKRNLSPTVRATILKMCIRDRGDEKELTLFTCSQKGTMRFVVRFIYKEAVMEMCIRDSLITFEELGVDSIMVDEAHNFKNLAIFSKMNNVSGISSSGCLLYTSRCV